MREIKFRAWCPEKNAFADRLEIFDDGSFLTIFGEEGNQIYGGNDDDVLMQYTGLKDSTGKEIYEGDVVTDNVYVVFDNGSFKTTFCEDTQSGNILSQFRCERLEVIGNIYENPELLSE